MPFEASPPVPLSLTGEGGRLLKGVAQKVGAGLVPARLKATERLNGLGLHSGTFSLELIPKIPFLPLDVIPISLRIDERILLRAVP
jgi:hypothetical protein